jgi:hypothetical protein
MNQRRYKMNLRNLFRVGAVISILSGLGYLFAPQAASVVDLDLYGLYLLQLLGASNIAIAVLLFLVSGMESSPARQAVVTAMIVHQSVSGIVTLLSVLGGVMPSGAGWISAVLSFMFALAFSYFRFIRPEAA